MLNFYFFHFAGTSEGAIAKAKDMGINLSEKDLLDVPDRQDTSNKEGVEVCKNSLVIKEISQCWLYLSPRWCMNVKFQKFLDTMLF